MNEMATYRVEIGDPSGQHNKNIHICTPMFQRFVSRHVEILCTTDLKI